MTSAILTVLNQQINECEKHWMEQTSCLYALLKLNRNIVHLFIYNLQFVLIDLKIGCIIIVK